MLGHQIIFDYCRSANNGTPCRKIFDCWFDQFDIVDFVRQNYGEETISKLNTPPKPKIHSLLELIEQAKKVQNKK